MPAPRSPRRIREISHGNNKPNKPTPASGQENKTVVARSPHKTEKRLSHREKKGRSVTKPCDQGNWDRKIKKYEA